MSFICEDCGCDDIRNYPDMGYACNNCCSKNYKQFDINYIDKETKELMDKFKIDLLKQE